MKSNIFYGSQPIKLSAVGAAVALLTLGFAGCGGGDNDVVNVPAASTAISVTGAGDDLFVGVPMTATCANGATGTATIGTTTPGEGTITVTPVCVGAVKLEATGIGKMRPIGAPANGSGDVVYDPTVNLPISNILAEPPAVGTSVTANPVTTLFANAVAPGTATRAALAAVTRASIAAAASNAASALQLPASEVTSNLSYLLPSIAEASARLAGVTALAVQAASPPTPGIDPLGLQCAKGLANVTKSGGSLRNAADAANALTGVAKNVATANAAAVAANGTIDTNASCAKTVVTRFAASSSLSALSNNAAVSIVNDVLACVQGQVATAKTSETSNQKAKTNWIVAVASIPAASTAASGASSSAAAALDGVIAAVASAVTSLDTSNGAVSLKKTIDDLYSKAQLALAQNGGSATNAQITAEVQKAVTNALAASTVGNFATPPTVGSIPTITFAQPPDPGTVTTTTVKPVTTTSTAAATTSTAAATTTTAAPTTTSTAAATTTSTAAATTTSTVASTTTTTSSGGVVTLPTLDPTVASTAADASDTKYAVGALDGTKDAPIGVKYAGDPIQFGPFRLTSAASLSTTSGFTSFKINSGAAVTTGSANVGDTVSVVFDLATCLADGNTCNGGFAQSISTLLKNGTTKLYFTAVTCSSPITPPTPPNSQCK